MQCFVVFTCLLLAIVKTVSAQTLSIDGVNVTRSWSGVVTASNPSNFAHPDYDDEDYSKCFSGATDDLTTTWLTFNTTFTTSAVRRVDTTCSSDMAYTSIFIYINSFDPTAPCTNFYRGADANSQGMSNGEELVTFGYFFFEAGVNYIFVAAPFTNDHNTGTIIVNVVDPVATGDLKGQPYWTSIDVDHGCQPYEQDAGPYALYTWTQATTGRFDLSVGFPINLTIGGDSWDSNLVLYQGAPVPTQYDDPDHVCDNLLDYSGTGDWYGNLFFIELVAGQQYTVLVGGDIDYMVDTWGFFIHPSYIRTLNSGTGFNQPSLDDPTCTADANYANTAWVSVSFTANSDYVVVAFPEETHLPTGVYQNYSTLPVYAFVYLGSNPSTPSGSPSTCGAGLVASKTMEGTTDADALTLGFATTSGQSYSLVVASDQDSYSAPATKWAYFFAFYAGSYITPTPTIATSAASTSSSGTTGSSSSSSATSATPSTATPTTSTTSSSSTATTTPGSTSSSKTSSTSSNPTSSSSSSSSSAATGSSSSTSSSKTSSTSSKTSSSDATTSPSSTTDNSPSSATSVFVSFTTLFVLVATLLL